MSPSPDLGVWVAAALTLCVFSFLYRDNPFYKFAEHLFVGVSAGYVIVLNYWTVIDANLVAPLAAAFGGRVAGGPWAVRAGDYRALLVVPALLGVLLLTRFWPRAAWLSRWSLAVIIGVFAGLRITGAAQADLVAQVQASVQPLWRPGHFGDSFDAIVSTVGVVATLLYFFFSREHRGVLSGASRIGALFLMIAFGAGYGFTVMSRVSLLIGRFQFLLEDWLRVR